MRGEYSRRGLRQSEHATGRRLRRWNGTIRPRPAATVPARMFRLSATIGALVLGERTVKLTFT